METVKPIVFKAYYIEFRFKKGSIFCYIQGIYYLLKSEKLKTTYCKLTLEPFKSLLSLCQFQIAMH
ncbi:DUF226 domain-containing protein [Borrelia puertoricensis]|uniref:DUF226 domain-containing protein n=1 Tax=Borrelia puertoricensis TaxID=2756107 RepID=UPI003D324206